MTKEQLCELAISAMQKAYAPYSGYWVGAALLCDMGGVAEIMAAADYLRGHSVQVGV